MANLEKLLKPGERIDWARYPWACPKKGDLIRATCLFDRDPQNTQDGTFIDRIVTDCEVRNAEPSANSGLVIFYYDDVNGHDLPRLRFSESDGYLQTWSSCSYWSDGGPDWIPLSAIKNSILHDYAATLKRRSDNIHAGLYP